MADSSESEQGFSKQLIEEETAKQVSSNHSQQHSFHQRRLVLHDALCIFSIPLFIYAQSLDSIPNELQQNSIGIDKDYSCHPSIAISLIEQKQQVEYKIAEFSQKMVAVYNKHNENLARKHDMTIYLKNIKIVAGLGMFRKFQAPLSSIDHQQHSHGNDEVEIAVQKQSNQEIQNWSQKVVKYGQILVFNSSYESGNLHCVFKDRGGKDQNVYYLFLQNDTNTHGYNQWFNFNVSINRENTEQILKYSGKNWKTRGTSTKFTMQFIIVNISKDFKYHRDMRILTQRCFFNHSKKSNANNVWQYSTPFKYYKNKYFRYNGSNLMAIDFDYTFDLQEREDGKVLSNVFFCLGYPYTYSKLIRFLKAIKNEQYVNWILDIEEIGKSEGLNRIYMLKLQRKSEHEKNIRRRSTSAEAKKKLCVVVLARQHPGETVSSINCEKLITQVLRFTPPSDMQNCYDWFFIPMANPDGVIHGNSRTNLKGYDINRCWTKNTISLSTQVLVINSAIEEIQKHYKIQFILDIHGHSKQYGCFGYFSEKNDTCKVLNYLLKEKCSTYNHLKSKFGISQNKKPTFRGQMYQRLKIKNAITLETSLFGYQVDKVMHPFVQENFKSLALAFMESVYEITKISKQLLKIVNEEFKELEKKNQGPAKLEEISDDSDSDPEGDYLLLTERKNIGEEVSHIQLYSSQKQKSIYMSNNLRKNYEQNFSNGKQPTSFEYENSKQKIISLTKFKSIIRQRSKTKNKRKPIYTNSNVNILPYDEKKYENLAKRHSVDHTHQLLNSKNKAEEQRAKNQRLKSSNSSVTRYYKVHGSLMESKAICFYPTSSNIKIDISRIQRSRNLKTEKSHSFLEDKAVNFRERLKAKPAKSYHNKQLHKFRRINALDFNRTFLSIEKINK